MMLERMRAKYGGHKGFEKAWEAVKRGAVKLHRFLPSGREIWTVVGMEEHLVDDEEGYCSCRHYYFSAMRKGGVCYHILAVRMAKELGLYELIEMDDEEYPTFLALLLEDLSEAHE